MSGFRLTAGFQPRGDQPRAIAALVKGLGQGRRFQTLLGVTGSGKTFTMANVIAQVDRPTLIIAHNKTLAAQLYGEFRQLFPGNAVEFFVSYYDYYQPEAYLPSSDVYIEKETIINEEIERMRHATTHALRVREDVVVVASVSCIYAMGTARTYFRMAVTVRRGEEFGLERLLRRLVDAQYRRSDDDFFRGTFRVRGDTVEIFPAYEEERALRVEFFGDRVERIAEFEPLRGGRTGELDKATIYPGSHYVTEEGQRAQAILSIREELAVQLAVLKGKGKVMEARRLEQRTRRDVEMLEQFGFCPGIENYSRHLAGRAAGETPPCLLDYFPEDFLLILDESHQTVPQVAGMYHGDRARKETLVEYGFRLPSALDNRPLTFEEFEDHVHQVIFSSATPARYERLRSKDRIVEQLIRPTGLLDPEVEIRAAAHQVDDLLGEIRNRSVLKERVLVTCLTKRMAEDLTDYYLDVGVKCRYLHSDVDTLERVRIVRDLRLGVFDVVIGINLLREGLDIPECSLVAVLDADKEGFLRSEVSLIQTIGRAARHIHGKAILYADRITESVRAAVDETERRRDVQRRYNEAHGITPETVRRNIVDLSSQLFDAAPQVAPMKPGDRVDYMDARELRELSLQYRREMQSAARELEFERAAAWRDRVLLLEEMEMGLKVPSRAMLRAMGGPVQERKTAQRGRSHQARRGRLPRH